MWAKKIFDDWIFAVPSSRAFDNQNKTYLKTKYAEVLEFRE